MKENLERTVFDKDKFNSTIDKEFRELKNKLDPKFFDIELASIDDFFNLYRRLFYLIDKNGQTNSHEFLIKESSEYIGSSLLDDNIQALLEEITELRQENLDLRQGILDSLNIPSSDKNIESIKPQELTQKLQNPSSIENKQTKSK
jgi:predicted metal-dependent hydrolase